MLRSAGESVTAATGLELCANPVSVPIASSKKAAILFMTSSSHSKESRPPFTSGREKALPYGADTIGLAGATLLARAGVVTVAATVSRLNVGKGEAVTIFVDVHAITDSRAELHRVNQNASHGARSDIDYVVNGTASLRESR